jgi:predicted PurR-regulated permease PerM
MSERLSQVKISFFSFTGNVIGRIASFFFVFVLSFYLTIEEEGVRKFLRAVTPKDKEIYAVKVWERAQKKLSRWLGSQLLLGLIVGCMTFIGLTIIGIPYAIGLALLAAVFELVPTVGPIVAAVPAVFIAFMKSPLLGVITLILYIVVQQLENNLLVPKIMQKTGGLNPVITLLALLVGAKLAGIVGMIMAIPVAMLFNEFSGDLFDISNFYKKKSK